EHRSMFIPSPTECLAEAALLAECAKHSRTFGNLECVFSYFLNEPESRSGTFHPYMKGLRKRQMAIASACETMPNGIVRYTDIKKFYPSVSTSLALAAWIRHCREAQFPKSHTKLGEQLIEGYGASGLQSMPAILTGPMFSHLLANLVLRDIDRELS